MKWFSFRFRRRKTDGRHADGAHGRTEPECLDSSDADNLISRGTNLYQDGHLQDAEGAFLAALEVAPDRVEAMCSLGAILAQKGAYSEASAYLERAIALAPDFAGAYVNLGNIRRLHGRSKEAIRCYEKAASLAPDAPGVYVNLSNLFREDGKPTEAVSAARQALAVDAHSATAHQNLGNAYLEQGLFDEAQRCFRNALEIHPDYAVAYSNLLLCLNYGCDMGSADLFAEHRRWAERFSDWCPDTTQSPTNEPDPERVLRIGYVSPDFRAHSVAHFIQPILRAHDRGMFEVTCYANVAVPDALTAEIAPLADKWRNIFGANDDEAAKIIRADAIDILVDLAGHTGDNRLGVFARKPAPVQMTYLGYPNTTGMTQMDYRLTDAVADPPGWSETYYTEELLRLPCGFLCYQPPPGSPDVNALPARANEYITFGSFNNASKIGPETVACWAKILRAVPNSRLLLKARQLGDAGVRQRLRALFSEADVPWERIECQGWTASIEEHLASYGRVDIGLDTYPYNGTTTTCEALWMGVPVITFAGRTHRARVGASLMAAVGLDTFIASAEADFVARAVEQVRDTKQLQTLRQDLRGRLRSSCLMDAAAFVRDLEDAYRRVWRKWCRTEA